MTDFDRLWISSCALAAVMLVRFAGPVVAEIGTLVWVALVISGFIGLILRKRVRGSAVDKPGKTVLPKVPASAPLLPDPSPVDAVRAQLEAWKTAGFTDDEAQGLLQEAIRTQIKQQGGWQP